jgi:hypothetical protein
VAVIEASDSDSFETLKQATLTHVVRGRKRDAVSAPKNTCIHDAVVSLIRLSYEYGTQCECEHDSSECRRLEHQHPAAHFVFVGTVGSA